jgi:hypothetical protein
MEYALDMLFCQPRNESQEDHTPAPSIYVITQAKTGRSVLVPKFRKFCESAFYGKPEVLFCHDGD